MCNNWIRLSLLLWGLFLPPLNLAEQLPVRVWTTAEGLPHNHINRIKCDSRGYLWICTDEGLARFDGYGFVNYGMAQGLPNLTINDFIEARDGTYWIATDGGICRFNPLGKSAPPDQPQPTPMFTVHRVSEVEVTNHVNGLLEDKDGSLWLATSGGLFRLWQTGGQVNIEAVEIGFPKGMRDERHVTKLYLDSRGTLWVMAISGLYQRTTEGRWERYGVVSDPPAIVTFTIHRPLWQRWWFLSLLALTIGGLAFAAHRYRVAQLVKLERIRLRIATDLHDDVGANLSLIAGVSEMLEQQDVAPQLRQQLALIANASRRSMDAMSDIVWMINPHKDQLRDLLQRLRHFAGETLTPRHIDVKFALPDAETDMPMGSESRREIFLICKEAIHNIARHAACTEVEITLTLDGSLLTLRLRDNGHGFDPAATHANSNGGQGVMSMRSRAKKLGGELLVTSQPGSGTEVLLRARLHT